MFIQHGFLQAKVCLGLLKILLRLMIGCVVEHLLSNCKFCLLCLSVCLSLLKYFTTVGLRIISKNWSNLNESLDARGEHYPTMTNIMLKMINSSAMIPKWHFAEPCRTFMHRKQSMTEPD